MSPNKMFFYEQFAHEFDRVVNRYDTEKRLDVVFDELLPKELTKKKLLDAGCGTGWFSQRATERGAEVTSLDLGKQLLAEVKKKCHSTRVVGSILELPFKKSSFDVVVTSEVIEHVTDYKKAIKECYRVLKPGGVMVLTTPNSVWHPIVSLANQLHLRPYKGLENWLSWKELEDTCRSTGFKIKQEIGIHAFPFTFPATYPLLDFLHRYNPQLRPIMVNMAIRCQK